MESSDYVKTSTEMAARHNITDNYLKWLILAACRNNVSMSDMDEVLEKNSDVDIIQSKMIAKMAGIKDVSGIKNTGDIQNFFADNPKQSEYEKKTDILTECILELSECSLALLEEFAQVKEVLNEVRNLDVDKNIYDIGFKILMKQNEVLGEFKHEINMSIEQQFQTMQNHIKSLNNMPYAHMGESILPENTVKTENTAGRKRLFLGKNRNEAIKDKAVENSTNNLSDEVCNLESASSGERKINTKEGNTAEKISDGVQKKTDAVNKYNEVRERITNAPVNDIFDVFEIIRSGAFSNEQAAVIKKGINKGLSAVEILEYAKPENSAETMNQLLDFLESVNIGKQAGSHKPVTVKTKEKSFAGKDKKNKNPVSRENVKKEKEDDKKTSGTKQDAEVNSDGE